MIRTVTITSEERAVVRRPCTLREECVVEPGERADWNKLSRYHYRSHHIPCVKAIYRARHVPSGRTVGVIVYAAASLNNSARNAVLGDMYLPGSTLGKSFMAQKINQEVELILRVVAHPTFRGVGLAIRIVGETMPLRNKRFIESSTAMGSYNPFFERCMEGHTLPANEVTARLLGALRAFGITDQEISVPSLLAARVNALQGRPRDVVHGALLTYERNWIKGRTKRDVEITIESACQRAAANALTRPKYYIWRNPNWGQ